MRFVEVETANGRTHPVNADSIAYIRPLPEDQCALVFGAGAHGLHELRVKGTATELAEYLEEQTRPRWLTAISGAMGAPPLTEEDRKRLDMLAGSIDDEQFDRAADVMATTHQHLRELQDADHEREAEGVKDAGGGAPGPTPDPGAGADDETKPHDETKPPETAPAALTRGAPKKKD